MTLVFQFSIDSSFWIEPVKKKKKKNSFLLNTRDETIGLPIIHNCDYYGCLRLRLIADSYFSY